MVVEVSVASLVVLFAIQRFGTHKVGNSFAPCICLWFALDMLMDTASAACRL